MTTDFPPLTALAHPGFSQISSKELLKNKIEEVLKSLTRREREIIKLRYGLGNGYAFTLEEVGRKGSWQGSVSFHQRWVSGSAAIFFMSASKSRPVYSR